MMNRDDVINEQRRRREFLYHVYQDAQHRNSGQAGSWPVNSADSMMVYQAMHLSNAGAAPLLFYHLEQGNISVSTPYPYDGVDKEALSAPIWQRGDLGAVFPHQIFITPKGIETVENDRELLGCITWGGSIDWNKTKVNQSAIPTPAQVVEEVLSRPCPIRFGDSIPTPSGFIFGELDTVLTDAQKRLFLVLIENTRWKDNLGQERFVSPFSIEVDETPSVEANEIWANLDALCKANLLARDDNGAYNFTLPGIVISNYSILREYYEGDGRANLSPNLNYKRVVLPSIPVNAKSFVQLLKSIQRRLYEAQTGEPLQFQDKEAHDYESITRITYSLQAPHFLIDPAISFEIIPLGPARVKVIAECYHGLAEESYNAALVEIGETWPEDTGSIIMQALGDMPQEEPNEITHGDLPLPASTSIAYPGRSYHLYGIWRTLEELCDLVKWQWNSIERDDCLYEMRAGPLGAKYAHTVVLYDETLGHMTIHGWKVAARGLGLSGHERNMATLFYDLLLRGFYDVETNYSDNRETWNLDFVHRMPENADELIVANPQAFLPALADTADEQPWGMIPNYRWDRVAVKGLWEGLTDREIAGTLTDVDAKTVANRLSLLRKQFPDYAPTRDELRKRRTQRKSG